MNKAMKKHLEDFIALCHDRLEKGEGQEGNDYLKNDMYQNIIEELSDIANHAFLEYIKVRNLKEMKEKFVKDNHD